MRQVLLGEVHKEIRIKKFTPAELDEEEQNLERLRRWYRDLRRRDVLVAPFRGGGVFRRLKESEQRLEGFAQQVSPTEVRHEDEGATGPGIRTVITTGSLALRLRTVVARRTEEILAEVAPTIRRFRTFLLVVTISLPLFLAASSPRSGISRTSPVAAGLAKDEGGRRVRCERS